MRRRLLWSTLAAVGVGVVLLGLPLGVAVAAVQERFAFDVLEGEARQAGAVVDRRAGSVTEAHALLRFLAAETGERFTLLSADGRVVVDTGPRPAPAGASWATPEVNVARDEGRPGYWRGRGRLAVAVPVSSGQAVLRVEEDDAALVGRTRRAWLAIAGLAVAALGGGAIIALYQGRRFAAPLEDLAESARRLGEGDFTARAPRSGLREADDVALALDSTAARLAHMIERSRSFGADASHQLRTPLTALRLDLEALEASGADEALVAAAMVEADRLEATIDELLALARPAGDAQLVDVGELAARRLDAWRAVAGAEGREVVLDAGPVAPVRARAPALGQCLQVLLDNALAHGKGTITVSVRHVPGPGVRLCVADEGPGFAPDDVPGPADRHGSHHGRGLPLARSLIEAEGGRLQIERPDRGARVCLLLPGVPA